MGTGLTLGSRSARRLDPRSPRLKLPGPSDKAERARKAREAKLLKEIKPQFIKQGVTAADLLRESRRGDAQKHLAGSGTVISGAVHVVGTVPIDRLVSERQMFDWMDRRKLSRQDAIACSDGRGIFQNPTSFY